MLLWVVVVLMGTALGESITDFLRGRADLSQVNSCWHLMRTKMWQSVPKEGVHTYDQLTKDKADISFENNHIYLAPHTSSNL